MATGTIKVDYGRPLISVSAGSSQSYSYGCNASGYDRLLVLGHNTNTALCGMYLLGKNAAVTVVEASNITLSVSSSTVTISNTGSFGTVNGAII